MGSADLIVEHIRATSGSNFLVEANHVELSTEHIFGHDCRSERNTLACNNSDRLSRVS